METFPWNKLSESVFSFREDIASYNKDIIIGFSANCIRFGIETKIEEVRAERTDEDRNANKKIEEDNLQFPLPKHLFTIDLSTPKTIGNDLLNIQCNERINEFTLTKKELIEAFVSEMEKKDGIFAASTFANKAREKLLKSTIYKLLVSKQQYYIYIDSDKHELNSLDDYEYNRIVSEYTDLLMTPELSSILPPNKVGKDFLFENPEYELQCIMQESARIRKPEINKHRKWIIPSFAVVGVALLFIIRTNFELFGIVQLLLLLLSVIIIAFPLLLEGKIEEIEKPKIYRLLLSTLNSAFSLVFGKEKKKPKIHRNTRKKIQNFLFQKHSTITTYYTWTGKTLYCLTWISMAVWSIVFVTVCLSKNPQHCIFTSFIFLGISIILLFAINAFFNWNSNSFFPRIIIAIIASWLLIGINADFVASQITLSHFNTRIAVITCFAIVILVLLKESKEHSPYYIIFNFREYNWKVLPILFFSLFISIFIGIAVQLATVQPLIKANNVLPSVEFSADFAAIEHHKTHTQLLINNLRSYKSEVNGQRKTYKHRCESLESLTEILCNDSFFQYKQSLEKINNQLDTIKKIDSLLNANDTIHLTLTLKDKQKADSVLIDRIDSLLPLLHKNISHLNKFSSTYCNTDSLLKMACEKDSFKYQCQCNDSVIFSDIYFHFLKSNIDKIYCVPFVGEHYLFPRMLLFHSFIVLLIAFVVQIIVSGKTVTEGL